MITQPPASPSRSAETPCRVEHFPQRASEEAFYPCAYRFMYLAAALDERIAELFRRGKMKGTVTLGLGNEATAVGMALPLRPGRDVVSLLQRDLASHLILGDTIEDIFNQYLANSRSPTHGREGNVHHGDTATRRFPMMSHLGNMLAPVVGGVYAARMRGHDAYGLSVTGDGGTSTGDFHESLNIASVRKVPVLYIIENNHYAFSTPTRLQYHCEKLSDRAASYGIRGATIDGTDVWEVYRNVVDCLDRMQEDSLPCILECMTLRLRGHAVYDTAEYVKPEELKEWQSREPVARAREKLARVSGYDESRIRELEQGIQEEIDRCTEQVLEIPPPTPDRKSWQVFAAPDYPQLPPYSAGAVKNLTAVNSALHYLLEHNPDAIMIGEDIGPYGSAFKSCKGLHARYGGDRVMDMPIAESAITGFALGASQTGARPIVEYQFADFATEAATQLGLNCGTWFFRSGAPAPLVFRLPCGGGITLGAFHSGEFEGLWSRFPGLKLIYPFTPQETFEALVAGFHDPNPCIVLEHKFLYWNQSGDISFDGDLEAVWRPRRYTEGNDVTVVGWGAVLKAALEIATRKEYSLEIWNPFILLPSRMELIEESVRKTGRLLVVQESGATAGMGANIVSTVVQRCYDALRCAPVLVGAPDVPVPFARELEQEYIPGTERIEEALKEMTGVRQ